MPTLVLSAGIADVIEALLRAHPDGVKAKDKGEWLPLHLAAGNQAPLEVVDVLLRAHPAGAKAQGKVSPAAAAVPPQRSVLAVVGSSVCTVIWLAVRSIPKSMERRPTWGFRAAHCQGRVP